ncbi:hypothetical protein ScPMuIL_008127 [Solemya velum]
MEEIRNVYGAKMASNKPEVEYLIEQFCSITGACRDEGKSMLEACSNNLQLAIEMHMDGGEGSSNSVPKGDAGLSVAGSSQNFHQQREISHQSAMASTSSTDAQFNTESDEIRAPIPQRNEVLVEEAPTFGFRGRKRTSRSVFDRFRDFQRETKQQEEQVYGASTAKQRTLEDLFRPPIDITYKGTFDNARDAGKLENKWLMVNIQNVKEFVCQALNRDVWSNSSVKYVIKDHFIFWQVYNDSEEGKKYMQFYKVDEWPYIAIIDPRTGENMVKWTEIDATSFCSLVNEFLSMHPMSDSLDCSPPAKRHKNSDSILDANEDDQLQAAISMSIQQSKVTSRKTDANNSSDDDCGSDNLETFSDSDDESVLLQKEIPMKTKRSKLGPCKKQTDSLSQNKNIYSGAEVLERLQ